LTNFLGRLDVKIEVFVNFGVQKI